MNTSARWLWAATTLFAACAAETDPAQEPCATLRSLQTRQGSQIQGPAGALDAFIISVDARGAALVTPPDATPCAADLAADLEAACRLCDAAPGACEETVTRLFDQPADACDEEAPDPDPDANSCGEDCAATCGDGACAGDETPNTCPEDCAARCGDTRCDQGESPVLCPQDCGGCSPNATTCDGASTLVRCDAGGQSSTRTPCAQEERCLSGACVDRGEDDPDPEDEIRALLLGNWRVTARLRAMNSVERPVEVGKITYNLEIFAIEPPSARFGIWSWSGALTADSICLITKDQFEGDGGECTTFSPASLGSCAGASCDLRRQAPARGSYDAVEQMWTMDSNITDADTWFQNTGGYINVRLDLSARGPLVGDQIAGGECERYCSWSVTASSTFAPDYHYTGGYQWSVGLLWISE